MLTDKVILFDGVCNLCNGFVQKIIKRDKNDVFKFASLQSDFGQDFLKKNKFDSSEFKSIILIDGDEYYTKSTAALKIGKELKGIYAISGLFLCFPKFIRDGVYDLVAKNRYKWFGKQESCWMPTPELKKKFIN